MNHMPNEFDSFVAINRISTGRMQMKAFSTSATSFLLCVAIFSVCGCAAKQQQVFYEKRDILSNMQICYLMYGEAAKANPSFAYDVKREGARRGISPSDCATAIQTKAINSMVTGVSAISVARQIEISQKQQAKQITPSQTSPQSSQSYATRDAYGNIVNNKSSYTARDANGNLVNSKDNYATRDNLGNIVNSHQPHQTFDANGAIVNGGQ